MAKHKKKVLIIGALFTLLFLAILLFVILPSLTDEEKEYVATESDASEAGQLIYTGEGYKVYRIAKVAGSRYGWDADEGITVLNDKYQDVAGTDLGAVTLCGDNFYINFGDTIFGNINYSGTNPSGPWSGENFLVAHAGKNTLAQGLRFQGYLHGGSRPKRALLDCRNIRNTYGGGHDKCYSIPNAMFSFLSDPVDPSSCVAMYAQYMDVAHVDGHNHKTYASYIAYMDWSVGLFRDYKPSVYKWSHSSAPHERYDFAMSSFVVKDGYFYMFGSPSGRFGGLKVARIEVNKFIDVNNAEGWEYYTNENRWVRSKDSNFIRNSARWVISPKDPNFTYSKDYSGSQIQNFMTIAEFDVEYIPYLGKYLLITGRPDSGMGVYIYTADVPEGPWEEQVLLPNQSRWTYYGTYTTSAFLEDGGKSMHFLATTWQPYGVYQYRVDFDDSWAAVETPESPPPEPTPIPSPSVNIDLNGDGVVNMMDYQVFITDYLRFKRQGIMEQRSNLAGGEVINMMDYQIFIREYLRIKRQ